MMNTHRKYNSQVLRSLLLSSIYAVLLAIPSYGQTEGVTYPDLSRLDYSNLIADSTQREDVLTIYYYELDGTNKKVKRGHKIYNKGILFEYSWIAPDHILLISGFNFDDGTPSFVNIKFKELYGYLMNFYENGQLKSIFNYDQNDRENGWVLEFDDNGILISKELYQHGEFMGIK
jgi:hypothetical protein